MIERTFNHIAWLRHKDESESAYLGIPHTKGMYGNIADALEALQAENCRLLAGASVQAYSAAKWRPISEAPKDGTWILLYQPSGETGSYYVGFWSADLDGWRSEYDVMPSSTFSHYQPLPTPPEGVQ